MTKLYFVRHAQPDYRTGEDSTFSLSAESKVVQKKTDIRAQSVRVKSVNFRSAVSLKKAMQESKFEREQMKE